MNFTRLCFSIVRRSSITPGAEIQATHSKGVKPAARPFLILYHNDEKEMRNGRVQVFSCQFALKMTFSPSIYYLSFTIYYLQMDENKARIVRSTPGAAIPGAEV